MSLHGELELLVEAGLTPLEALSAATSVPADRFRLPDRGRIAPGLRADLLLVNGDPTSLRALDEPWKIPRMERIAFSRRITETEYDTLLHAAATARPGEPAADPLKPVRWRDAPSLY